jgi:hypothetical protein
MAICVEPDKRMAIQILTSEDQIFASTFVQSGLSATCDWFLGYTISTEPGPLSHFGQPLQIFLQSMRLNVLSREE